MVAMLSNFIGGPMTLYTSPYFRFSSIPDQTGKVAVITGSNTGIGYWTALELARKGARVIVAARSEEKGNKAIVDMKLALKGDNILNPQIEFMKLDLSSLSSVKSFAYDVRRRVKRLDMLILNAGIMVPPLTKTTEGFESQFGVNHLGHFLLAKILMPLIQSSQTRVVTVSSLVHLLGKIDPSTFYGEDYEPW